MNRQPGDIDVIQKIDAYIKGKLSSREAEELWMELLKNPEYLEYLETELVVNNILGSEKEDSRDRKSTTPVFSIGHPWKWVAVAASVAILLIAINFFGNGQEPGLQELTLGEISLTENLASPMVFRSQSTNLTEADSLLNLGFQAALSGNLSKALEVYEQIISDYSQDPVVAQAYLNIGIIRYNNREYRRAAESFEEVLARIEDDVYLEEKANWYRGNAYINLDSLEVAREAIQRAYALDGVYRQPAYRLLLRLDQELGPRNRGADEPEIGE